MQIAKDHENQGYTLWLSTNDTHKWANRINAKWPCSQLSGHRIKVSVDDNGLYDFMLDGQPADIDSDELCACVGDYLPDDLQHLWPVWGT